MSGYFVAYQKLKIMRSTISFLFLLVCVTVMAQTEIVTTGPIPLGIKVYDYANERDIDISTICDGFDIDGLPLNLILPYKSQLIMFLPSITKENADNSLLRNGSKPPRPITNFNYEYKGRQVAFLGSRSYSSESANFIEVGRRSFLNPSSIQAIGLQFSWRSEAPPITLDLFLDNAEIDEWNIFMDSVMQNLFSPEQMLPKSYQYWLDKRYASELNPEGRPIFPVLPQGIGELLFKTNAPQVSVTKDSEKVIDLGKERTYGDDIIYSLNLSSPGNYVITLSNPDIRYGPTRLIYPITVKASFWKQGGYYMLAALGLLIVAFLFYRFTTKKKVERSLLQKQVSDAELKAVRAQLNPHFLFNALNAIQNLVNQNQTDKANDYIVKLSKLLRTVLAQSNEALHALEKEINLSKLYLELENLRSPFDFNIEVSDKVDINNLVPNMILQPYLENAVVHGIQKNRASEITLKVDKKADQLILTVRDNGQPTSTDFQEGTGMALGRSRLDIIRKQVGDNVKAGIKARASSENGFIVEIRLPLDL